MSRPMEYMSDAAPAGPLPAIISGAEYPCEPPMQPL